MSTVMKQRSIQRTLFTKAADALLGAKEEERYGLFRVVEAKYEALIKLDALILDLTTEEFVEQEMMKCAEYEERFILIRAGMEDYGRPNKSDVRDDEPSNIAESSKINATHLPKLKVQQYELSPSTWLSFWGSFKLVHEDKKLHEDSKFQYLQQMLTPNSKAASLLQPFSSESYFEAVDTLKKRFGRENLIIETHIRSLLRLVLESKSNTDISILYDKLHTQVRALETLGLTKDKFGLVLCPLIEGALPPELLRRWERTRVETTGKYLSARSLVDEPEDGNNLDTLMSFLEGEVQAEERAHLADSFSVSKPTQPTASALVSRSSEVNNSTSHTSHDQVVNSFACIFCERAHPIERCYKALNMSYNERIAFLRERKVCTKCTRANHTSHSCRTKVTCIWCKKGHISILCWSLNNTNTPPNVKSGTGKSQAKAPSEDSTHKPHNACVGLGTVENVYLQTLVALIDIPGVKRRKIRVLLDTASEKSYISEEIVSYLGLQPTGTVILSHGLFGGAVTAPKAHPTFNIELKPLDKSSSLSLQCELIRMDSICSNISPIKNKALIAELQKRGIMLTDVNANLEKVDVLIGANYMNKMLTGEVIPLPDGPLAINSILGWTLLGGSSPVANANVSLAMSVTCLPSLWELGAIGIHDKVQDKTQDDVFTEMVNSTVRVDGRYQVNLPWKEARPVLKNNRMSAINRLNNVTKKLQKQNMFNDYDLILKTWIKLGIIEEVLPDCRDAVYYLPHRPVIKSSSETTKIRPVFDASWKAGGYSLNECLEPGPNLILHIPDILCRFRLGKIGVSSDIEKAFLQIIVNSAERDMLRFLWWKEGEVMELRHCRLVFGLTSSPCLLNVVISKHLNHMKGRYPESVKRLSDAFYVDNALFAVNSIPEYEQAKEESVELMREGNFNLTQWHRNRVIGDPPELLGCINVLGLLWNLDNDMFYCKVPTFDFEKALTKRSLLSLTQAIYDILGFWCPVTVTPKLILQLAWRNNLDWDDELTQDMKNQVLDWGKQLPFLAQCAVPRALPYPLSAESSEIHVFCDASGHSYAACVFLRTSVGGTVRVQLLQARHRIAPLERVTIPRLELMAATIAVRLYRSVAKAMNIGHLPVTFWTDSKVSLTWITQLGPWSVFITNRVKEIRASSEVDCWKFCPGLVNPADLPSRGCNGKKLLESQWWKGPEWLYLPGDQWPMAEKVFNDEVAHGEARKATVLVACVKEADPLGFSNYFSKYTKIVNAMCYILRMKNKMKGDLTNNERIQAEIILFKYIQVHSDVVAYAKEKKWQITWDEDGLCRIITRIAENIEPASFQKPILLPDKNELICRLVEFEHVNNSHASVLQLLSIVRQKFWIVHARRIVKNVVYRCQKCARFRVKAAEVPFAPLPMERTHGERVFQNIGLDLAGPCYLKDNGEKVWIVIFTCATFRCCHFEIVENCSTEALLLALRRFIARRGRPEKIFCDNGTNIVGSNNYLSSVEWSKIEDSTTLHRIKWIHQPPAASWWGGFFERVVKMLKDILRRVLGRACLNLSELTTLVQEAEALINLRPLTRVNNEPGELSPLTPNTFLNIYTSATDDIDQVDGKNLQGRAKYIQKIRHDIRTRFRDEYISMLVNTGNRRFAPISPGDLVMIGDDNNKKRMNWPLALVLETYPGRDGAHRVALVKTAQGQFTRPWQKLYPLEGNNLKKPNNFQDIEALESEVSESMAPPNQSLEEPESDDETNHVPSPKESRTRTGRIVKKIKRLDL